MSGSEALFDEGNRHQAAGDAVAAEACFRAALRVQPDLAEALANLALIEEDSGRVDAAEASFRQAIALAPGCLQIYLNLGVLLMNGKRFDEAEVVYRAALERDPASPAALSNYGVLLACMKREGEAEQCYRLAMALDQRYTKARFNLGYILLRQGRFEEGWWCLEAREWVWYDRLEAHFQCPRWRGEALAGKALVIGFEAGHGDMIQFGRYAAVLKAHGAARLAIICQPALKALFATLSGVDQVYSVNDDVPASGWDFWSPPMSLPYYCETRLENIPAVLPYLAADPQRTAKWRPRLPAGGLRVGLVWRGNVNFENDRDRSLPSLAVLAPLAAVAGVTFVSLQKGAGEDEPARLSVVLKVFVPDGPMEDFADTAALIGELDLVISVDTAVAHLTGALGKPCWLLLPDYRTDWRWLSEGSTSPWYPGMRLFRQPPGGDWTPVVSDVVDALILWKGECTTV